MVQIINFPSKQPSEDEVMRYLAHHIMRHLVVVLYEKNILHVPVQAFVRDMCRVLTKDGFDIDQDVAESMMANADVMGRIERVFLKTLAERGHVPSPKD